MKSKDVVCGEIYWLKSGGAVRIETAPVYSRIESSIRGHIWIREADGGRYMLAIIADNVNEHIKNDAPITYVIRGGVLSYMYVSAAMLQMPFSEYVANERAKRAK
jgi:hypothetical protein